MHQRGEGCLFWGIFEQKIGISSTEGFSYVTLIVTMAPLCKLMVFLCNAAPKSATAAGADIVRV